MKRKQRNPTRSALDSLSKVEEDSPKVKSASRNRPVVSATASAAADKAEEIRSRLDSRFPSLVKIMIKSSVSGGFWLGLPTTFCSSLPKKDTNFTLVNENCEEYTAKYLPRRWGLSGGWGGFARAHNLVPGDALVLHLVEATKFKVYIVKAQTSAVVEAQGDDLDAQNLETIEEGSDTDDDAGGMGAKKSKPCLPGADNPGNHDSEEAIKSVILEGPSISSSIAEFKKTNDLESFTVTERDLEINNEIPEHVRPKYYRMCRSQHSFLHKDLGPEFSSKVAAIMITGIVSLGDKILKANVRTAVAEHEGWENSLKAYKGFGMNVGFMHARIDEYMKLSKQMHIPRRG